MENPKVSIVMPSLNVADYIRESINSAINQTLKEIEIICVDAGSTDGTVDIIKEFAGKDTRVRLINSPVKSYGYQMNLGIDASCGEYIGIIETDDWTKPEMYEELYKIAEEQQADFIKADFYWFRGNGSAVKRIYAKLDPSGKYYNRIINPAEELGTFRLLMNTWSGIYRRRFLEDNGIRHNETPGAAYQDTGFWFKTFCCAKRVYFVNRAYYMYRQDNMNASRYNPNLIQRVIIEYGYIYNWLKDQDFLKIFKGPFAAKKYNALKWGFDKTPNDQKMECSKILAKEMALNINSGEYEEDYFTAEEWNQIQALMRVPESLYYETELERLNKQLRKSESREAALKRSLSFRIGRAITWFPRKVRGGVRCFSEHGFAYTLNRFCWHVIHLK